MKHRFYRVESFEIVGPYILDVRFDDEKTVRINFEPVLHGGLYGPLRDLSVFDQVKIDPEVKTLVWPNGADFNPSTLHDWEENSEAMRKQAEKWELIAA
ncbi:MAG: DUF2442 domain-containing protein [Pyrinomonadaceae bacterium]|nr:DUF2442 domain-containing protein [Pyrinomonadaceae bacterium]MBP6213956.1 DUF2442 domain-containing protein [Pyrinomonadaceae bacterium]